MARQPVRGTHTVEVRDDRGTVSTATLAVRAQLAELTAFVEKLPPQVSRLERLAGRGAVSAMRARLDWWLEVRRELDADTGPTG